MRHNRKIITVAILISLQGCGLDMDPAQVDESPAKAVQRDVYTRIEDCMQDWGDANLCVLAAEAAKEHAVAAQQQQAGAHNSSGFVNGLIVGHMMSPSSTFVGPQYVPGSRYTYTPSGQALAPKSNTASAQTAQVKPTSNFTTGRSSFSAARSASASAARSSSSSSGGFGKSGGSFGGSSG